jgi:hypothetical protein
MGLINALCTGNKISNNYFENNILSICFLNSTDNQITYNNFYYQMNLNRNIFSMSSDNEWIGNFWNRPRLLPVIIWDVIFRLPLRRFKLSSLDIDWRPAKKPNDLDIVYNNLDTQEKRIIGNKIESYSILFNLLDQFSEFQILLDLINYTDKIGESS